LLAQADLNMERMRPSDPWSAAFIAAAIAILIWPLFVATPAMPDYPARIAGFYLVAGGANTPPLAEFYGVSWTPIPNLAGEVLVPVLSTILPLETATRVLLALGIAMWVLGPCLIHRALYGRLGIAPLAGAVFAYNANLMWGFFNYYFAAGLCLIIFAGWIASNGWNRWLRVTLFALLTLLLYFCHLIAALLFLLLVATYELGPRPFSWSRTSSVILNVAIIALPVGLLILLNTAHGGDGEIRWRVFSTWLERIGSAAQQGFNAPAWTLISSLAVLFGIGLWRGAVSIHPRMPLPLVTLLLVTIVMPEAALGGALGHVRVPAFAAAVLFASSDIRLPHQVSALIGLGTLGVLTWLSVGVALEWKKYDSRITEFRKALQELPVGARLVTAVESDLPSKPLYWHIAEFAIIDRGAFTAQMFATEGQHVVHLKPSVAHLAARSAAEGAPPDIEFLQPLAKGEAESAKLRRKLCKRWRYIFCFPCNFDVLLLIDGSGKSYEYKDMPQRHQGSFFSLYDLHSSRSAYCPCDAGVRSSQICRRR
jgi:hypothetical protein